MSSGPSFGVHIFLQKTGQRDDRLRISWDNDTNGYLVEFDQYTVGNHAQVVMPYMCDVERYLEKFFNFLEIDHLPYEWFQVDVPSFPAVKLDSYGLRRNRDLILDAIHGLKYDWPHECFHPKH
jgi:hypothetical protein